MMSDGPGISAGRVGKREPMMNDASEHCQHHYIA
jgi:hypothetical protein